MTTRTDMPAPPSSVVGPLAWLRNNLFSSPFNSAVTVILGAIVIWAGLNALTWVIIDADWEVVTSRIPLYIVGQYPSELYWRPIACLLLVSLIAGLAWRVWDGPTRYFAIAIAIIAVAAAAFSVDTELYNRILLLCTPVAIAIGYRSAQKIPLLRQGKWIAIIAAAVFIISILLVVGGAPGLSPVNPQDIGGLMLNLFLAFIGIVFSLPIGIALALGRRSKLPVVKAVCVAFIEIIRGVPLITLLFMSRHILPLTFPENIKINTLYLAAITITLFSSAYMAENVRGGMAAVHSGQTEAARALGLRDWQTTLLITLPQGLRNVIPAIVGQFIGLFKDTSLVFIIGMLDIVEMGRVTVQGNTEFTDNGHEMYIFVALVFWIFTFSMSYVSRRIEGVLGVGRR